MDINIQPEREMTVILARFMRRLKFITVVAATIICTLRSSFGGVGETEEQCNRRYGVGTVTRFDQQTKTKSIRYNHTFAADVDVEFQDSQATWICYSGHYPITMGESDIPHILDEESQGHKWTLTYSNGQITHEWMRDDGIKASEYLEPNVASNPRTFLAVSIPPKPELRKPEMTFLQMLGQALLIGIAVGVGSYLVIKLFLFGLDILVKFLPKK